MVSGLRRLSRFLYMTVLFVGQNPAGPSGVSASIKRLEGWADQLGLEHFSFTNVGHDHRPKWRRDLDFLSGCCTGDQAVVALGRVASEALTRIGVDHYRMPHPSGLNRQLNDDEFLREAIEGCRSYLEKTNERPDDRHRDAGD